VITHSQYFPSVNSTLALATGASLGRPHGWTPAADTRAGRVGLQQITQWREDFVCIQASDRE
jgi:hypothetical protein